jgi:hypothetical protein
MKYLSLIIVIAFIAFTFWFSKKTEDLTIDQMNKMNNMITQYMTQSVQNNQPNVKNIEFSKIYTEVMEPGKKMKAHFKFSYMEPNEKGEMEKVYRKGSFLITSDDGNQWNAQIEEAGDVKIEFMEPFDVAPQEGGAEESTTPEANKEAEAEESASH